MSFDNILLYEQSSEALEAVKSGNAIVSSGGIRRKGEAGTGFLELAKPAVLSVADFQSLFERKEHGQETDEHLGRLDVQLALSTEGMKEIKKIGWLNNAAIQRTYVLTYEGFCQTLYGLEAVTNQISKFEQYVKKREIKQLAQETQTYINYMKTDAGDLRSKKYSVMNGRIAEHLDQISAFLKRLMSGITNNEGDSFVAMQVLVALLPPFSYVVRKYSALYFYENDGELMPGDYEEWVKTISSVVRSKLFREKLTYYINLKTSIPFKDKMRLSREMRGGMMKLVASVEFDRNYIESHTKEEYLSIENQIRQKIEMSDYYIFDRNAVIFLDESKTKEVD